MKIGLIQLTSVLDFQINLEKISDFLGQAKNQKIETVFLPECFYSISDGTCPTPFLVDPVKKNEHYLNIQALAKDFGLNIVGGSAATLLNNQVINRCYNFDSNGNELAHYDKIHLFKVNLSNHESRKVIDESQIYTPGSSSQILELGEFKIGLSICFDLRFPKMYRDYFHTGCQVLTGSAAFTVPTGMAHWHVLNRARAIENQSYMISAAQWGVHNEKIQTFGHSLVIGPWGEIIADGGEGEKLLVSEISLDAVKQVRLRMKVDAD